MEAETPTLASSASRSRDGRIAFSAIVFSYIYETGKRNGLDKTLNPHRQRGFTFTSSSSHHLFLSVENILLANPKLYDN
ncbi:unnamed protein product [Dovyalis caffra]|uniref:Uncharacterized protein n=1 Tax=Dovyalis caffra TaxID=77055 RepID=A0AAV1R2A1_9ROSI|nr:unnamed protein product [Dovyalis caffra]